MKSRQQSRRGLGPLIVIIVILAAAAFLYAYFYIPDENIEVTGNTRYRDSEIVEAALPGYAHHNAAFLKLFRKKVVTDDLPFVNSIDVEILSRDQVRLHVNENYPIGYVLQDGVRFYFDASGLVIESMDGAAAEMMETAPEPEAAEAEENSGAEAASSAETEEADADEEAMTSDTAFRPAVTDVPPVTGLTSEPVAEGETISVEDPSVFQTLLTINRMLSRFETAPDEIRVEEDLTYTLVYGKAEIRLGSDRLLEEKLTRAAAILPQIRGLEGVLHLEDYSSDTINIIFEQTKNGSASE